MPVIEELRAAARALPKAPGFTLTALLSLAVGIGAALAVYSLVDATLLRPLPVADPDRLYTLTYGALVVAAGLLACVLPARRAAQVDPVRTLRCE